MKWFKHETRAIFDEKIQSLMDLGGLEAYGFYFAILELIGEKIDQKLVPEVTVNLRQVGRYLHKRSAQVQQLLNYCSTCGLLTFSYLNESVTIRCENILKRLDEYRDRVGTISGEYRRKDLRRRSKKKIIDVEEEKAFTHPSLDETKSYFKELNCPLEAEGYFDHFSSNGWRVGGKAPMKDWRAAARNWVRRISHSELSKRDLQRQKVAEKLKNLKVDNGQGNISKRGGFISGSLSVQSGK